MRAKSVDLPERSHKRMNVPRLPGSFSGAFSGMLVFHCSLPSSQIVFGKIARAHRISKAHSPGGTPRKSPDPSALAYRTPGFEAPRVNRPYALKAENRLQVGAPTGYCDTTSFVARSVTEFSESSLPAASGRIDAFPPRSRASTQGTMVTGTAALATIFCETEPTVPCWNPLRPR